MVVSVLTAEAGRNALFDVAVELQRSNEAWREAALLTASLRRHCEDDMARETAVCL